MDINNFSQCKGVIDVVYNPLKTTLCYEAEKNGIPYVAGLEMLVGQAVSAVEFFTAKEVDRSVIKEITANLYHQKQNIVLIGMPSCGKTSIGRKLAKRLGMSFVDLDTQIAKNAGTDIPTIFSQQGEAAFRAMETQAAIEAAKRNHTVISCGGGIVKNEINMQALKLNGFVVYIDRRVDKLISGGHRPLSKDREAIIKLKKEREHLYEKYSDIKVENNSHFKFALEKLLEVWNENTGY